MKEVGFLQGSSDPYLLYNIELDVTVMVHGYDFIMSGPEKHCKTIKKTLADK